MRGAPVSAKHRPSVALALSPLSGSMCVCDGSMAAALVVAAAAQQQHHQSQQQRPGGLMGPYGPSLALVGPPSMEAVHRARVFMKTV